MQTWGGPSGAVHGRPPGAVGVRGGSARGGEAAAQQIAGGSAEVVRHGAQRHRVSAIILVFQGTSGQFYQKEF